MKQKIVTVGVSEELREGLSRKVDRRAVGILSVPSGVSACALHETLGVDLLVVAVPLEDMPFDELVESLGSFGLPRMVVIAGEDDYRTLSLRESDRLTVLPARLSASDLSRLCTQFVRASPRAGQRIMARLEVQMGDTSRLRMVQTRDISATGMKVMTGELLPIATWVKFSFNWPGDPDAVTGDAEVVRHTSLEKEGIRGMGIRFTAFDGKGGRRLREHIRQSVDWQERD
ncbi:MAG: hypothetical protein GY769_18215 [bacterium]|nr:hypothetical protein [bacterium]